MLNTVKNDFDQDKSTVRVNPEAIIYEIDR